MYVALREKWTEENGRNRVPFSGSMRVVWAGGVKVEMFIIPKHSMSVIYPYVDPSNYPNVGKYAIHGVSGIDYNLDYTSRSAKMSSGRLESGFWSCFSGHVVGPQMIPRSLELKG